MRWPLVESAPASRVGAASTRSRALVALAGLGLAMVVPAIYVALRYPLIPHASELTDLGLLSGYTRESFWLFVAVLVTWFAAYAGGIALARRCDQRAALVIVLVVSAIAGLILTTMYPVNATDMHMYAARSRLFTAHGVDPIAVPPSAFPTDPWRSLVSPEWSERTSPYGPLWTLVAAPITLLAGDNLPPALIGFKLLALNAYLAAGALIAYGLAGRSDTRPAAGALVFLWNPLVLWEAVGNGHNDALVALLLVAAMAAALRGPLAWVIPPLVAATLLKYVAVVLLPLALVAVVARARAAGTLRRTLVTTTIASAAIVVAGLAPFYDVAAVRESVTSQGGIFATSPGSVAIHQLRDRIAEETIQRVAQLIGAGAVTATILFWLGRLRSAPARLPIAAFEVVFVFLLLATLNFRGWYLIWLVALAAICGGRWEAARAAAWTSGAMAAYPLFIWVWGWREYTFDRVELIAVTLMFLPPIAVTLAQIATRRAGPLARFNPLALSDTANRRRR